MSGGSPTYLVTGATGFLGRHVVASIRRRVPDANVIVLVRDLASWEAQTWRQSVEPVDVVVGPLHPSASWDTDDRLAAIDGIFHLAAEVMHTRRDTDRMVRTNVEGTLSMVRVAAAKKSRLVFVSTSGAVSCSPRPGEGVYEEAPWCDSVVGSWPYYASKIRAEKEARKLASKLGIDLVIMRPPVLLGPGDHRFRSTGNVLRVLRKRLPFIIRGGMNFADIRDVAEAIVAVMLHPSPRPVYHLAGTASTLDEFFRSVASEAGIMPSWIILPPRLVRLLARANELAGSPLHILPDPVVVEMAGHYWDIKSRYAEADLGYASRAPEQTIRDTVAWLREHHPDLADRGDTGDEQRLGAPPLRS